MSTEPDPPVAKGSAPARRRERTSNAGRTACAPRSRRANGRSGKRSDSLCRNEFSTIPPEDAPPTAPRPTATEGGAAPGIRPEGERAYFSGARRDRLEKYERAYFSGARRDRLEKYERAYFSGARRDRLEKYERAYFDLGAQCEVLMRMLSRFAVLLATAISGNPSPLRSPAATSLEPAGVAKLTGRSRLPLPSPR